MAEQTGWEHLLEALKHLWEVLVDKGYAGWLVWAAEKILDLKLA